MFFKGKFFLNKSIKFGPCYARFKPDIEMTVQNRMPYLFDQNIIWLADLAFKLHGYTIRSIYLYMIQIIMGLKFLLWSNLMKTLKSYDAGYTFSFAL